MITATQITVKEREEEAVVIATKCGETEAQLAAAEDAVCDLTVSSSAVEEFPLYKGSRPGMPLSMVACLPLAVQLVSAMGIPVTATQLPFC